MDTPHSEPSVGGLGATPNGGSMDSDNHAAVQAVEIQHLEKDVSELRQHLESLDSKYVRIERYIHVERIVGAGVIGVLTAALGFVWKVVTGA